MAETSTQGTCFSCFAIPILIVYLVLKYTSLFHSIQMKIQAAFIQKMSPASNKLPMVISAKAELFKSLNDFKTPPTILEVGAGDCRNLEYYPKDSTYIIVEPNGEFHEPLKKRVKEVGAHLKLQDVHSVYAEKLEGIEDESVDAYVMTHVTCSVKDMDAVLKEAKRVLKPGGRLYIFHHFLGPNGDLMTPQALIERWFFFPIIGRRLMGCDYDRYIEDDIRRHFPKTETKVMELPMKLITIRYHLLAESVKT